LPHTRADPIEEEMAEAAEVTVVVVEVEAVTAEAVTEAAVGNCLFQL